MARADSTTAAEPHVAWRKPAGQVSLAEVHRSIVVPVTASFWRKLLAFSGPGFLVAVGYMDPGNWACDLAEVVGSAIALQLLFGIPLVWGCVITCLDVLAVLYLQNKGFRYMEALVITLIATIGSCFAAELIFSKPSFVGVMLGFAPSPHIVTNQAMLYIGIGIIGATVMPHNLYLHSSIVQTRKFEQTPEGKREAIKYASIDSAGALMFALFINAAILILAASAFHWSGHENVAQIQDAYKLLSPLLGVGL